MNNQYLPFFTNPLLEPLLTTEPDTVSTSENGPFKDIKNILTLAKPQKTIKLKQLHITEVDSVTLSQAYQVCEFLESTEKEKFLILEDIIPVKEIFDELVEHDVFVKMLPRKKYTTRIRIKSVKRGVPHIVEPDWL